MFDSTPCETNTSITITVQPRDEIDSRPSGESQSSRRLFGMGVRMAASRSCRQGCAADLADPGTLNSSRASGLSTPFSSVGPRSNIWD